MAVKPVNDQILLRINFTLRQGFAYIFNEMQLTIVVDTATDWDANAQLFFGDVSRNLAGHRQRVPVPMSSFGFNGVDLQARSSLLQAGMFPRTPMQTPDGVSTINMNCSYQNLAAAVEAAGTVSFNASFFVFDLEQIQFFPANWSQSVTPR